MNNSLDIHSKPLKVEDIEKNGTILGKKVYFNPRDSKKGRLFMPVYDHRFPLVEGFDVKYVYFSIFKEENNISGNHYHHVKQEIIVPLDGDFEIHLVDVSSKISEILQINPEENIGIYIPVGISHKVISKGKTGVMGVLASNPSNMDDEIDYEV